MIAVVWCCDAILYRLDVVMSIIDQYLLVGHLEPITDEAKSDHI